MTAVYELVFLAAKVVIGFSFALGAAGLIGIAIEKRRQPPTPAA